MTDAMTDEYAVLFELEVDDVDGVRELFKHVQLAAKLKHNDIARYQELILHLKSKKVPRLREFEQEVNRVLKLARQQPRQTRDGFSYDAKGQIKPSQENIRVALNKLGVTPRYDRFSGMPVIEGLEGFGPALDDHAMNRLWLLIEEKYKFRPSQTYFQTVVMDEGLRNEFHPVRDYLDSLEWDGTERIDTWLTTYCGTNDTAYTRAVGAIMLIAGVRRVRQPGAKFDEMLVLESAEGYAKSTMLAVLAVKEEWFTDSLPLNVDDKRMIEGHSGKWIVEFSDLHGMRAGDVERIKAQLSRQRDRARLAYGRLPIEVPRQFVGFGTTNSSQYLASTTGNRRFWPIRVERIDIEAFTRDRDQLWAEAAVREAQGASIRLPQELWDAAAKEQRAREEENPFFDILDTALGDIHGVLFADDAWRLLRVPSAQRGQVHNERLGKAMRELGFRRVNRRRGGAQRSAYVRGDADERRHIYISSDLGGWVASHSPVETSEDDD